MRTSLAIRNRRERFAEAADRMSKKVRGREAQLLDVVEKLGAAEYERMAAFGLLELDDRQLLELFEALLASPSDYEPIVRRAMEDYESALEADADCFAFSIAPSLEQDTR